MNKCQKKNDSYNECSRKLHYAFKGKESVIIRLKSNKLVRIPKILPTADIIINDIEAVINEFKKIKPVGNMPSVFLKEFDNVWKNQRQLILDGYLSDVLDSTGKNYYEPEVGGFKLYRGTNRNESCHRRINAMFPDRCGDILKDTLLTCFKFSWNFNRNNGWQNNVSLNGIDNTIGSVGNIHLLNAVNAITHIQSHYITPFISNNPTKEVVITVSNNYKDMLSKINTGSHMSSLTPKIYCNNNNNNNNNNNIINNSDEIIIYENRKRRIWIEEEDIFLLTHEYKRLRQNKID